MNDSWQRQTRLGGNVSVCVSVSVCARALSFSLPTVSFDSVEVA